MSEHRAKLVSGFTEQHGVILLVHIEEYPSMIEARTRERTLKRWRRAWKFDLIEKENPTWRNLSADIGF
jgi:putative endonuclease